MVRREHRGSICTEGSRDHILVSIAVESPCKEGQTHALGTAGAYLRRSSSKSEVVVTEILEREVLCLPKEGFIAGGCSLLTEHHVQIVFLLEAVLVGESVADLPAFVPCHGGFTISSARTVGVAGLLVVEIVTPLVVGIVGCRRFESELFVELYGCGKVANPLLLPCLRIHILSLDYRVDPIGVEVGFCLCSRVIHKVSQVMLANI